MNALFAEAIGTFVFLTVILLAIFNKNSIPGGGSGVPLVIGLGLTVAILLASSLSGSGHLNPVVSLAMLVDGKISSRALFEHVVAQVAGALAAVLVFRGATHLLARK